MLIYANCFFRKFRVESPLFREMVICKVDKRASAAKSRNPAVDQVDVNVGSPAASYLGSPVLSPHEARVPPVQVLECLTSWLWDKEWPVPNSSFPIRIQSQPSMQALQATKKKASITHTCLATDLDFGDSNCCPGPANPAIHEGLRLCRFGYYRFGIDRIAVGQRLRSLTYRH